MSAVRTIPETPRTIEWAAAEVYVSIPDHSDAGGRIAACVSIDDHPGDLRTAAVYAFVETPTDAGWDGVLAGVREVLTELGCPAAVSWAGPAYCEPEECGCSWTYRDVVLGTPITPTVP